MLTRMKTLAGLVVLALFAALPARAVEVQRVVSPGGIEAWLVEDHSNPILSMDFAWEGAGAKQEPKDKAGLATMTAALLDEGAAEMDSMAFRQALEDNAIRLGYSAGMDLFRGQLRTLTDNRAQAFDLLTKSLTQPRFDEEPVERIRSQLQANLKQELEDPNSIAARAWWQAAFPDHPYGVPLEGWPETVAAITVPDMKAFAAQGLAKDNLVVSVVGDITAEELKPLLDRSFGQLPEKAQLKPVPEVAPKTAGAVQVIERTIPQSVVLFGQHGLKRSDPDWWPAYLANYILGGGGFSSRLMEEVREKRGLAYGVHSYLSPLEQSAVLYGGTATKNERVAESIQIIRDEWRRMAQQGPTPDELKNAKTYLTGSFPLQMDSTASIASLLTAVQVDELGIDYLDRRNAMIEAVTLDDIKRVTAKLLQPGNLQFVVVGKPANLAAGN